MKAKKPSLRDLFVAHNGKVSDKWDIYISEYDRLFQPYRDQPVRLLEIGIQNGGSLEVWRQYFSKAKRIVGSDIDPACEQLTFDDPKIAVVVADANTDEAEKRILAESNIFDLVIDDGSHRSGDIVRSFARYFRHLTDGGLYIAEDLHCSYWQDFEGGIFQPYSSIAFFKRLADTLNYEHWGVDKTRIELLDTFSREYHVSLDETTLANVHSVEFINSMCVIKKASPTRNVLGRRFIAGTQAVVDTAPLPLHDTPNTQRDQTTNTWSSGKKFPEDEAQSKAQEVEVLTQTIGDLNRELVNTNAAASALQQSKDEVISSSVNRVDKLIAQFAEREAAFVIELSKLRQSYAAAIENFVEQHQLREKIYIQDLNKTRSEKEAQSLLHAKREKEFLEKLKHLQKLHETLMQQQALQHTEKNNLASKSLEDARQLLNETSSQALAREIAHSEKSETLQVLHAARITEHLNAHAIKEKTLLAQLTVLRTDALNLREHTDMQIEQVQLKNLVLTDELNVMRHTRIWRWTSPLRYFASVLLGKGRIELAEINPKPSNVINVASTTSLTKATRLEELLSYHDERFIYCAYLTLLGRAPDSEGMLYYIKRIRSGISKIEILSQLRLSKEGAKKPIAIANLDKKIKKYYWQKVPIIGTFLKLANFEQINVYQTRKKRESNTSIGLDTLSTLVSSASRGPIDFDLIPITQLARDTTKRNSWISLGGDPNFNLAFSNQNEILAGWYVINLRISACEKKSISKFYLDTGNGFNESESVVLPYLPGQTTHRTFLTERSILAIRFDPNDVEGAFSLDALELTSITESDALNTMAVRLALHHPAYDGMKAEDVAMVVQAVARADNKSHMQYLTVLYASTYQTQSAGIDYAKWIKEVEEPSLPTQAKALTEINSLKIKPLISIIMPVYNTPEVYLRACIESVRAQWYENWELCVADDASPNPKVRNMLEEYQNADPRIRTVFREKNGHISRSSNSALEVATGDFVALLDHDDALPSHALYYIVLAINDNPTVKLLYSDEDKIDGQGKRFEPHFKSDWNPDLFFSQNYVSHLGVYRRDLLSNIGGFRIGFEGSQDQDLLLRCLPHIDTSQIIHIAKVLYHWRATEGSTALGAGEKSYTTEAGVKALRDYFAVHGPSGVQIDEGVVANTYRVQYPIPSPSPLVSLLIPTRDRLSLIEPCVRSIINKSTYENFEILILDNGSVEPATLHFFKAIQIEDVRVKVLHYDYPFNYSAINNYGVQHANGSIIGLINNDIEVISPGWLTEMVSQASRSEIGCVGAKLYFENDTIQHAGVICSIGGVAGHSHKYFPRGHPGYFSRLFLTQSLSAVTAACLLVRRDIYDEVGGLDEENLRIAFNDVDFCLKVNKAGYRNLWTPYAEMYHYESISRGTEDTPEKQARFQSEVQFMRNKWGSALDVDPFYNPNLTRELEDFSIRSA